MSLRPLVAVLALLIVPNFAFGQGAQVAFGGLKHDSSQPGEISADSLAVDQAKGTAEFKGSVVAGQAALRLTADRVLVEYATEGEKVTGEISKLSAYGNVTLVNGAEAAEGQEAIYTLEDGKVRMSGDVLLTQGQNAISGEVLNIDLNTGTALFEGRVRTIFQSSDN